MAFDPVVAQVPTSIGTVRIKLVSYYDPANPGTIVKRGEYQFQVLDQDGHEMFAEAGDLQPHLSPEQITQVSAFLDWCRAQAEATLPVV